MRYVCEFAGETDGLLIRDIAENLDDLEEVLEMGLEVLGPMMRCYPIMLKETTPELGLVRRDALASRTARTRA